MQIFELFLEGFTAFVEFVVPIGNFLWEMPMLIALTAVAVLYTIGTRGFQFRCFSRILRDTFGRGMSRANQVSEQGISSFRAFCMALCNTLGVGNIVGVGIAVGLGGPGAILWIWMADLLGTIIKYGEIFLGSKYQEADPETGMYRGGIMFYVKKGLGRRWRWVAVIYAGLYGLTAFNTPATQVNSIASAITQYFPIPPMAIGVVTAALLALVVLGGLKRISGFAEKVVPTMAVGYLLMTAVVLLRNAALLPDTFALIFRSAFTGIPAILGGFGGASASMAIRYGFARGFYSNGAGCGDAPFFHSSVPVSHPGQQAIWGISEVFVDMIVCTCTGLVILSTGAWETGLRGAALTTEAFARGLGGTTVGGIALSVIITAFAFTTALAGIFIGESCLRYFTGNRIARFLYRSILCVAAVMGSSPVFMERLEMLWLLSDFNIAICDLLSILVLCLMCREVFSGTREYEALRRGGTQPPL